VSKLSVDGVFNPDPNKVHHSRGKLKELPDTHALRSRLASMDASALNAARTGRLPIHVVSANDTQALSLTVRSEFIDSRVGPDIRAQ